MKLKAFHPISISIDGEQIVFRIKRQTMEENLEFMNRLREVGELTAIRFISRESSGPEQETDEKGQYKIPIESLVEKKIRELPQEKLDEYNEARAHAEKEAQEFFRYAFSSFVKVEKGLIEELEDGTEKSVTDGIDILRLYGAREDVLSKILEAVRLENILTEDQKKTWRSPTASSPSSKGRRRARAGRKPKTTAKSAATEDSPNKEDAKANQNGRSGLTEISSSNPVPSSV